MFTRQELIYLATGARCLANQARKDRDAQRNPVMKDLFERSAKAYDELAAKCERLKDRAA